MPWQEQSIMGQRAEFVALARGEGANISRLCERFGISRQTGHLWLRRFAEGGAEALGDRSRRPRSSPGRTGAAMEELIAALRARHPAWGGRKLKARLEQQGHGGVPSASTITAILRRRGLITPEASEAARPWTRFEHERPNDLWQMDFKGPIATQRGACHALTVLDDHSRYSLGLRACRDQRTATVQEELTRIFRMYGLPWTVLADNGPPWAGDTGSHWTVLKVWLLKLGVVVIHGRPYHPQTQGKEERFHRTLTAELLRRSDFRSVPDAQRLMDPWREIYNLERPHESVGMQPPVSRYRPSEREMPMRLPVLEPSCGQTARVVREGGHVRYGGRRWYLGKAWDQETVGLTENDGLVDVHFGPYLVAQLNLRTEDPAERVRPVRLGRCAPSPHGPHSTS